MAKETPQAKGKVKEITLTAVGLHYRMTKTMITELEENLPLRAMLKREPENRHDKNAIAVYVVEHPFSNLKIGYLKRQIAADLASAMDEGKFKPREVWIAETSISKSGIGGEGHVAELLVKL